MTKVHKRDAPTNMYETFESCGSSKIQLRGEAVIRKHLRRKLRSFEEKTIKHYHTENQGQKDIEIYQFYSAKKYPKGTHQARELFFTIWRQQKINLSETKNLA